MQQERTGIEKSDKGKTVLVVSHVAMLPCFSTSLPLYKSHLTKKKQNRMHYPYSPLLHSNDYLYTNELSFQSEMQSNEWEHFVQLLPFATNNSTSNNWGITILLGIGDILSFFAMLIFLIYTLARTLYTFPWVSCPLFRKCCFKSYSSLKYREVSWGEFFVRLQSNCYFFSRPIARVLLFLIACEFFSTSPSMILYLYGWMNTETSTTFCNYQGFSIQFFGLAAHLWCVVLAVWMFWILVLKKRSRLAYLEVASHTGVWGIASILTSISIGVGGYDSTGAQCWITKNKLGLRLGVYYIPLWLCIITVFILYTITAIYLLWVQFVSYRDRSLERKVNHISTSAKLYIKLLALPFVYIICWVFPTVRRVTEFFVPPPTWLIMLHGFSSSPQGFYNVVIFFVSEFLGSYCDRRARLLNNSHQISDVHLQDSTGDYIRWIESEQQYNDDDNEKQIDE